MTYFLHSDKNVRAFSGIFVEDMQKLKDEINEHLILADEIVCLLGEYDNSICEKFVDLSERVEFDLLVDE